MRAWTGGTNLQKWNPGDFVCSRATLASAWMNESLQKHQAQGSDCSSLVPKGGWPQTSQSQSSMVPPQPIRGQNRRSPRHWAVTSEWRKPLISTPRCSLPGYCRSQLPWSKTQNYWIIQKIFTYHHLISLLQNFTQSKITCSGFQALQLANIWPKHTMCL